MSRDGVIPPRATATQLLEVHLEELGAHSWWKALLNTVTGSYGSAQYRFVARPPGAEHNPADHQAVSGAFPVLRWAELDDAAQQDGWSDLARSQLAGLEGQLVEAGWRRLPHRGGHWWSLRFTRTDPAGR